MNDMTENIPVNDAAYSHYLNSSMHLNGNNAEAEAPIRRAFDTAWGTGNNAIQPFRHYHSSEHFYDIGLDQNKLTGTLFDAIRLRAGIHHDVVYYHVDHKANNGGFAPNIRETIEKLVTLQPLNNGNCTTILDKTELSPGQSDVLRAANILFQHTENFPNILSKDSQTHGTIPLEMSKGQNEYLSALFAAQVGLDAGIPLKYILAEMAMIEATIPFRPAERMTGLKTRLEQANATLKDPLTEDEMAQTIKVAREMANHDVNNFRGPFSVFIENTQKLLRENVAKTTDNPVQLMEAMQKMKGFMKLVKENDDMRVFHTDDGSVHLDEANAYANIDVLDVYLTAGICAIALLCDEHMKTHDGQLPERFTPDLLQQGLANLATYQARSSNDAIKTAQDALLNPAQDSGQNRIMLKMLNILGAEGISDFSGSISSLDASNPDSIKAFVQRLRKFMAAHMTEISDGDSKAGTRTGDDSGLFFTPSGPPESTVDGSTAHHTGPTTMEPLAARNI